MQLEISLLPGDVPPPAFPAEEQRGDSEATGARPKVLVVDDESLITDTIVAILEQHGFRAYGAYTAEDAIKLADTIQPDVMLSDVLMPKMTGVELAIHMRKNFPQVRVMLFSGQAATAELMRQAESDGYDFELFPKPIHPEDLIAKLKQRC